MLLNIALDPLIPFCSVYLQQHGPLLSRVAGLSSVTSASELSAAIAAAPSAAALQSLAAAAGSAPHQAWMIQQYKVGTAAVLHQQVVATVGGLPTAGWSFCCWWVEERCQ
jgi:hypothetical protein